MKKKVRKTQHAFRPEKITSTASVSRYIFIGLTVLVVVFAIKIAAHPINKPFVLGTSILARGGDDSSGSGSSGSGSGGESSGSGSSGGGSTSGSSGTGSNSVSGSSNSGNGSSGTSGESSTPTHTFQSGAGTTSTVNSGTFVDCVGPDNKHFQTSFKSCADLNHAYHHDNFSFTVLKSLFKQNIQPIRNTEPEHQNPSPSEELKHNSIQETPKKEKEHIKLLKSKIKKELESEGAEIELKPDDKLKSKIKKADGTETEVEEHDALEEINNQLEDKGIDIAKTETNDLSISKNGIKAQTHFPLSVNPTTKELSVTTPAGVKIVTILPDEAVQRILLSRIINSVETEIPSSTASEATGSARTILTELNNEAVFKVKGFSNKKALGFIPVSFAKTVFVSATDGKIVRTDETFFSKLLEAISF